MEGQINPAPGCNGEHVSAQTLPDCSPGLFLGLSILSLATRTLAFDIELRVFRFDEHVGRFLSLAVRPEDAVLRDERHLVAIFQVEGRRQKLEKLVFGLVIVRQHFVQHAINVGNIAQLVGNRADSQSVGIDSLAAVCAVAVLAIPG
ncbi:hypothetical protein D3C84_745910 [compost metagenome]